MNYEPLYTFAEKHRVPYNELCTALRAALAAPQPEPVALCDALRWSGAKESHGAMMFSPNQLRKFYEFASRAAPPAAPAPGDMVMVPLKFVQDFNTLAHNYCLRAVPPDYYSGTEADAFQHAYSRCGSDLRRLREILAAAPAPAVPESPSLWLPSESMTRWGENWWSYESMKAVADQNYQRGFAHGVRFADESLTAKDIIPDAAPAVREPLIDEMDAVASKYAHKLALDLECVLSDYNGKWWDTAMQTIGEYRMAMNRIHEQESPTHMGEPVLPKHGIGGGGNG